MGKLANSAELEKIIAEIKVAEAHIGMAYQMVEAATRGKTDLELVTERFNALPVGAVFHAVSSPSYSGNPIRWFKQAQYVVSEFGGTRGYQHPVFLNMLVRSGYIEITEVGKVGDDG